MLVGRNASLRWRTPVLVCASRLPRERTCAAVCRIRMMSWCTRKLAFVIGLLRLCSAVRVCGVIIRSWDQPVLVCYDGLPCWRTLLVVGRIRLLCWRTTVRARGIQL